MRVEQVRGGVVEAVHEVHVAVVNATGGLVARTGDAELVTFWRSAAKPFQALPLVADGAADRFGLTSEELAPRVRVALERAGTGGSGARAARQDRLLGAGSAVRPAPAVVRPGGAGLPDSRRAPHGDP